MPTRSTGAAASTGGCSYAPSSPHPGALSRPARPTSTGATAMRRGSQVSWAPAHAPPRCSSWAVSTRPRSRRESETSSPRSASSTPSGDRVWGASSPCVLARANRADDFDADGNAVDVGRQLDARIDRLAQVDLDGVVPRHAGDPDANNLSDGLEPP